MSLFVINASSSIAMGLVRQIARRGDFERIVCADLYPNYWALERFVDFKHKLAQEGLKSKLEDVHFVSKQDLEKQFLKHSHLLYVTHDYFRVAPSKVHLLRTVAELAKKSQIKKTVGVLPIEYDHFGEASPVEAAVQSENDALAAYPEMTQIKSDLTFGDDCEVVRQLLVRIAQGRPFEFKPAAQGPSPVHVDDLGKLTLKALTD